MGCYHLVSAFDRNYMPYAFVAYQSIINSIDTNFTAGSNKGETSSDRDELIFHLVIDDGIDEAELKLKTDSFSQRNLRIITIRFVIHKIDASLFRNMPSWGEHANFSVYYRLLIDKFIEPAVWKILYFDVDVIFNVDMRKLFKEYPLEGKVLGAVLDPGIKANDSSGNFFVINACSKVQTAIKLDFKTYFNSGVLLINMNEWRKRNIGAKSLALAPKYKLIYPDQDLLNYLVPDYEPMSWSYNFQLPMFYLSYNNTSRKYDVLRRSNGTRQVLSNCPEASNYEEILNAPGIVHFTNCKPWSPVNDFIKERPTLVVSSQLSDALEQWYQIADTVIEFKEELPQLPVSGKELVYNAFFNNMSGAVHFLAGALDRSNKKRRSQKNIMLILFAVMLSLFVTHLIV